MLNAVIIVVAVVFAGYLAFSKRLAASSNWKATVTPLASIMGSGFLVSAPLLGGIVGIALGVGASLGLTSLINSITVGTEWPMVISLPAVAIAAVSVEASADVVLAELEARGYLETEELDKEAISA